MPIKQKQTIKRVDFDYESDSEVYNISFIDTGVDKLVSMKKGDDVNTFDFEMLCDIVDSVRGMNVLEHNQNNLLIPKEEPVLISEIQKRAAEIQETVDKTMSNISDDSPALVSLSGLDVQDVDPELKSIITTPVPETPESIKEQAELFKRPKPKATAKQIKRIEDGDSETLEI